VLKQVVDLVEGRMARVEKAFCGRKPWSWFKKSLEGRRGGVSCEAVKGRPSILEFLAKTFSL